MDRNHVMLVGKLSGAPEEKMLPSGDTLLSWRLVIRRKPGRRRSSPVDSLPCVTFDQDTADAVLAMRSGDYMEVQGSLRCRIFGPPKAKIWRYDVEASAARPVAVQTVVELEQPEAQAERSVPAPRPETQPEPTVPTPQPEAVAEPAVLAPRTEPQPEPAVPAPRSVAYLAGAA